MQILQGKSPKENGRTDTLGCYPASRQRSSKCGLQTSGDPEALAGVCEEKTIFTMIPRHLPHVGIHPGGVKVVPCEPLSLSAHPSSGLERHPQSLPGMAVNNVKSQIHFGMFLMKQ